MLICLSLWLDMRGKSCANDLPALLDLYGGVRKRFDKAGLPAPQGAAVAGVLHHQSDLEDDDGEDGGLSLLELDRDGAVWLDGERAGLSLTASGEDGGIGYVLDQYAIAISGSTERSMLEEQLVLLLGTEKDVLPLLVVLEQRTLELCRLELGDDTVGDTALLVEVRSAAGTWDSAGLLEVRRLEREIEAFQPGASSRLGAVLKPDVALWFEALQGSGN